MAGEPLRVTVRIDLGDESGPDELEEAVESLRTDLSDAPVDVERVTVADPPPAGAKSGVGVAAGVLLISGQVIAAEILAQSLLDWVRRWRRARLAIDGPEGVVLVLPDSSPEDLRRVIALLAEGTAEA